MSERVAVVTGPGTGIGRAIAERLRDDGWMVVGVERDADGAADVGAALGERGVVVCGDVTDRAVLREAAAGACGAGRLAGWVNNAGVSRHTTLHEADADQVQALFAVNLDAVFWACAEAVRAFLDQAAGGSIVNLSSIHGRAAFPGFAAYDTAKGGVEALTRYVAVEYAPAGVRANAIAPGAIATSSLRAGIAAAPDPGAEERQLTALQPMGRMGDPSEVAALAAFLLSDDASFISGQTIGIDGAASARCHPFPGALTQTIDSGIRRR